MLKIIKTFILQKFFDMHIYIKYWILCKYYSYKYEITEEEVKEEIENIYKILIEVEEIQERQIDEIEKRQMNKWIEERQKKEIENEINRKKNIRK
jgi:hypothetical protein